MKGYFLVSSLFLLFPVYAALLLRFLSFLFHFLLVTFLACYPLASFRLLNVSSVKFPPFCFSAKGVEALALALTLTTVPAEFKGPKDRSQCD